MVIGNGNSYNIQSMHQMLKKTYIYVYIDLKNDITKWKNDQICY